jgi:hypothetical protein
MNEKLKCPIEANALAIARALLPNERCPPRRTFNGSK